MNKIDKITIITMCATTSFIASTISCVFGKIGVGSAALTLSAVLMGLALYAVEKEKRTYLY